MTLEPLLSNWVFTGILAAFIGSFTPLINQYFKQDGLALTFASSLLLSAFWLPFTFATPWPSSPLFYVSVMCGAIAYAIADTHFFETTATYGGGVTSRFKTLILPLVFITWLPVSLFVSGPELLAGYAAEPLRTALITGLIAAMFATCFWLARNDAISKGALLMFLPAIIAATFGNIFNKIAMESADIVAAIILYSFVIYTTKWVALLLFMGYKKTWYVKKQHLARKELWYAAGCFLCIAILFNPLKNVTVSLTTHPAYASVIFQTTPFMIALIYKAIGFKEEANVKIGLLMVVLGILFIGVVG